MMNQQHSTDNETNDSMIIDVGSSTIKVYGIASGKSIRQLFTRSVPFKVGFDQRAGISEENKKELFELIDAVKKENPDSKIKIFATALFRKMERKSRIQFVDHFFERTGLFLNIIDQDFENYCLQTAFMDRCTTKEPALLINIGGGSTELVVMYGDEAIERHNIDLGVASLLAKFAGINESLSQVAIEEVLPFIQELLPPIQNSPTLAFYNGGELTYMRLAGYPLEENLLFTDTEHPSMISAEKFARHNQRIFQEVTLEALEATMPHDPKWMHGARGCSLIAQAICDTYGIQTIIPSDSNTAHGIARHEFRYVTLSSSFRKHLDYILGVKEGLEIVGVTVLSPHFTKPKNPGEEFVVFTGEEGKSPLQLERHHLDSIEKSDALIVCSPNGYVGASALIEIGYAHALGKRIIFTEKPEEFMLNTLPAEFGL